MPKVVNCVKQTPEKGAEIIYRFKDGIQAIIAENIKQKFSKNLLICESYCIIG